MAITLAQAQAHLAKAQAAYDKALEAQSYSTSSDTDAFSASRQNISDLLDQVNHWNRQVDRLSGGRKGGLRARRAVAGG